ncbi:hypothetical protein AAFP30_14885 [Gordonia sp. CPCC 205515]|uniref:hypothetical protein n=1 Tax=Gordonia sp. CPCC 205515 TaxID=3140791 RepID=UPI003AF367EF
MSLDAKEVTDRIAASWRGATTDDLRRRRLAARAALEAAGTLDFKPVSSAKWVDITIRQGRVRVQIEHDVIRGVTPEMIKWWFQNLARTTTWNGVDFSGPEVSFYHLWHHRDHIAVTPLTSVDGQTNSGFQVGALSRIDEQFNDYRDRIHQPMLTTRLDDEEFSFDIQANGRTAGTIIHRYHEEKGGVRFYAETLIGLDPSPAGVIFNHAIRPFVYRKSSAEHWIRHNIEETGRTQDILPVLYDAHRDEYQLT